MDIRQLTARLDEIERNRLYEGLTLTEAKSVKLWEHAGRLIKEAALTPDQIQQLFTSVEQGATTAGGNRTMIGQGKDAAEAIKKAYNDLVSKVQNSGPVKGADAMYDQAVAKIEAGLGGPDNAVNQVIQKYRAFAKANPIAQSLIYSILIAAAGISGGSLLLPNISLPPHKPSFSNLSPSSSMDDLESHPSLVIQQQPFDAAAAYSPYGEVGVYEKDIVSLVSATSVNALSPTLLRAAGFEPWKQLDQRGRELTAGASQRATYRIWQRVVGPP
jgi:hypothetical protein